MDNKINLLDFEWQVLSVLFSQKGINPPDRKNFIVLSRKYTGVGSYTEIEVKGFSSLVVSRENVLLRGCRGRRAGERHDFDPVAGDK